MISTVIRKRNLQNILKTFREDYAKQYCEVVKVPTGYEVRAIRDGKTIKAGDAVLTAVREKGYYSVTYVSGLLGLDKAI